MRERQLEILIKVEKIVLGKPRVENFRKLMFREQKKASSQGGGGAKKVSKREGRVISSKVMVSAGDAAKNSSTCKKREIKKN